MRKLVFVRLVCGTAMAVGAVGSAGAQVTAADATDTIKATGDIIVTASKRSEQLKDVPISVSVLTADRLEDGQITDVNDYFQAVPNVSLRTFGNSSRNIMSIRGVSNLGGDKNTIGVYVDELNIVPTIVERGNNPSLFDVERIEVLRGPQGTAFGRNVVGGAISITTKKPSDVLEGELMAEYGSFDTYTLRGVVNIPISDTVMTRVTGFMTETDGYLRNIGPAGKGDEGRSAGARFAVRFLPTEALTIDLSYQYSRNEQAADSYVPTGITPPFGSPPIVAGPFFPERRRVIDTDFPSSSLNRLHLLTGRMEYDANSFSVISVTGFIHNEFRDLVDTDFSPLAGSGEGANPQIKSFSQELRIVSDADGPWTWLVGAMYSQDKLQNDFVGLCGAENGCTTGPDYFDQYPGYKFSYDAGSFQKSNAYALFAEIGFRPFDRLKLTIGGRLSREKSQYVLTRDVNDLFLGFVYPIGQVLRDETKDFSPKITALYEVSGATNIYASVAKGYKPGGIDVFTTPRPDPGYRKETAWNFEAGIKSNLFDGKAFISASAFYFKWNDMQLFAEDGRRNPPEFFTVNAARASSRGFELEFSANPTDAISLGGSIGYVDAKFDRFENAFVSGTGLADISGSRLPQAPKWTGNAFAQGKIPISSSASAFVRGEYSFTTDVDTEIGGALIPEGRVPGYGKVNLRIGVETDRISVTGFVENLFDSNYIVGYRLSSSSFSGTQVALDPRRFGARLSVKF